MGDASHAAITPLEGSAPAGSSTRPIRTDIKQSSGDSQASCSVDAASSSVPPRQSFDGKSVPGSPSGSNVTDQRSDQDVSGPKKNKTRTRSGCLTCRKRRKLCDMGRPSCSACDRLELVCQWPANVPGEASRSASNRPRKRYESTSTPSLPSITPRPPRDLGYIANSARPRPQVSDSTPSDPHTGFTPFLGSTGLTPTATRSPGWSAARDGGGARTMEDFVNVFGGAGGEEGPISAGPSSNAYGGRALNGGSNSGPDATVTANPVNTSAWQQAETVDNIFDGIGFDDTTLQLWAADLFNIKDPHTNPWDSLSNLLAPRVDDTGIPTSTFPPPDQSGNGDDSRTSISRSPITSRPNIQSEAPHKPLLAHYQDSLSRLVACIPEDSVNGFDAFTTLASATASSSGGRGLHLATLAWAGRHMSNLGQVKYEALSERLAEQAKDILLGICSGFTQRQRRGENKGLGETEAMTLLGGLLMLVQFKICRGDVWGYLIYLDHLRDLAVNLFGCGKSASPMPSDSMLYSFFENLVFHDMLSTFIMQDRGSIIATETLETLASGMSDGPNTLTGTTFRVLCVTHQMAKLIRDGRKQRLKSWNDENLIDTVTTAGQLEKMLEAEKERYQQLVNAKPASFAPWQFMHEGFRVAAILSVRSFILGAPPCSIGVRLLVRQSLSLLETMYEQDLPGFCSAHWQLFVTALCACPHPGKASEDDDLDDRARVERLYDSVLYCVVLSLREDLGFKNVARSRQVVHEIWNRNQGGQVLVDWLDVIQEWEWELFVV